MATVLWVDKLNYLFRKVNRRFYYGQLIKKGVDNIYKKIVFVDSLSLLL